MSDRNHALTFVADAEDSASRHFQQGFNERALADALYTFSDLGLFAGGGIELKDVEDAIRIWAVVETVRTKGFPHSLRL